MTGLDRDKARAVLIAALGFEIDLNTALDRLAECVQESVQEQRTGHWMNLARNAVRRAELVEARLARLLALCDEEDDSNIPCDEVRAILADTAPGGAAWEVRS